MPLAQVVLTDTFSEWMVKTNLMITLVNSLSVSGDIISTSGPSVGDTLVWNGSVFTNVTVHGDGTLAGDGTLTITGGPGATTGMIYYFGSNKSLF